MPKIFVSYRREDSLAGTGRIDDRLVAHFGRDSVFRDVDTIDFGVDFRQRLSDAVGVCDVLLAVIGEHWLTVSQNGQPRLQDARDFVRIEIEAALQRGIPVIPVLLGKTAMPHENELPASLANLAFRHALQVDLGADFHHHMDKLIRGLEKLTPKPAAKPVEAPPAKPAKPKAESPAERVRRLKAESAKLLDDARALVEIHDYHAAADLLAAFPPELTHLRDAALFADAVAKRDRLAQLHEDIQQRIDSGKLKDPRLPGLIAAFVEIKPNDADMLDLAREFPAPKRGTISTNALGMRLAWVPHGSSWLGGGGGKPGTTKFTLEQGLWCAIYPVTQAEWQKVMGGNPPSHFKDNPRYPVESVSWNDVQTFLQKLDARGGDYSYRLPTEQEWEYICRGGPINQDQSKYHYYFAKSKSDLAPNPTDDLANKANSGNQLQKPSDVGSYLPNPLGIYDMHGNVWEWTSSLWEAGGSARVFRGGCWSDYAESCAASYRYGYEPGDSGYYLGFRLLAVPRVS